jgi:hypothetical protein
MKQGEIWMMNLDPTVGIAFTEFLQLQEGILKVIGYRTINF